MNSSGAAIAMPALLTSAVELADRRAAARDLLGVGDVEEELLGPGRRVARAAHAGEDVPAGAASRAAHAAPIPDDAPVTRTVRSVEQPGGDLGALLARVAAVRLDPLRALVVACAAGAPR